MKPRDLTFSAIGTTWRITVAQPVSESDWSACSAAVFDRIAVFDRTYSRFRNDSLVAQMARRAGKFALPPDGFKLLQLYEQLYKATDGRVTPLIGQVMADAGYDAQYSFDARPMQSPPAWETVISFDTRSITMRKPALLDFGAAGKGYLIDIVGALLAQAGFTEYVVDAGGDILHRSVHQAKLSVGLENPFDTSEALGIARLTNASLCASAGSKRKWGKYHHIIDPTSLEPAENIAASWVLAPNAITADGVATALFFVPATKLQKRFKFAYATLSSDMKLTYSRDFPAQIFEAAP